MKKFLSLLLILITILTLSSCQRKEKKEKYVQKALNAMWVASIGNIDFPSKKDLDENSLKAEIDRIVSTCKGVGLNAIIFQVRPCCDALYNSKIFPTSSYLGDNHGDFDALKYIIQKAHENSIELHAWINPYRISTSYNGDTKKIMDSLDKNSPAFLYEDSVVKCENNGVYLNPGSKDSQNIIISGVDEIIKKYDVDGIHFDDYFYPYDLLEYDDTEIYNQNKKDGQTIDDFRRESVNELIKGVYNTIKGYKKSISFGVSPFGIWANKSENPFGSDTNGLSSYYDIFADSKAWIENGWVDYICPQIYWSSECEAAPFETLVDWWDEVCAQNDVAFFVGHTLSKLGTDEKGWSDSNQIINQIEYASKKKSYKGSFFFRYTDILNNKMGIKDKLSSYYLT